MDDPLRRGAVDGADILSVQPDLTGWLQVGKAGEGTETDCWDLYPASSTPLKKVFQRQYPEKRRVQRSTCVLAPQEPP